MRAKHILTFVAAVGAAMAFAVAGTRVEIPGSKLSLVLNTSIEDRGKALDALDEASKEILADAREFSFETKEGVLGSVMTYVPKEEFLDQSEEWSEMIGDAITEAIGEDGKVTGRSIATFSDKTAHFISTEIEVENEKVVTEFVVLPGKTEIVLLALSADASNCSAKSQLEQIVNSLNYDGQEAKNKKQRD